MAQVGARHGAGQSRTEGAAQPPFRENPQPSPGHETRMRERPDHGESSYRGAGKLCGRRALVTGADSGIGRAVALAFAREGADVAIAYLDEHDDARETERWVKEAGRRALLLDGDLGDPAHCAAVVRSTVAAFGGIDVVVNNAAHQGKTVSSIEEITPERVERTFRTNVFAMFSLVREAIPHLQRGSSIVNTASIQAYQPSPAVLDYAATKGAIVTFTKGLARELAPRAIRANAVAPGPVWTPLIAQSYEVENLQHFGEQSPMKRPAQPAELAPAYVFLASDDGSYVSGEILGVTGGRPLA
jgi:NAD(P)-dependent dehydrogenase (short-subunit alcohol dehydrogenase family)